MRCARFIFLALLTAACCCVAGTRSPVAAQGSAPAPRPSETVDRIVARVEGDIILLSEARELAAYQQLVDGHSKSQEELIGALIEQWVVRSEAQESRFPLPPAEDVDAESSHIESSFPSAQAYHERMAAVGLTPQALRRIVEQQLYLERYLDYKFRPAIQIDDDALTKYYQDELSAALRARGQTPPPLDDVRDRIREVLMQRGINERANSWFEETKSRLQVEITPAPAADGKL